MNALLERLKNHAIPHAEQELMWMKAAAPNETILTDWVEARIQGIPLAYVLNSCAFHELELYIDERVLIPRFETEQLVNLVLKTIPENKPMTAVDLGCGSGAIALAIKRSRPNVSMVGVDASMAALEVAYINQEKYIDHPVMWVQSDWLDSIDLKQIDIIISNPPYVESDWQHPSITHEPHSALFSGKDGLDDIRKILIQTQKHHHLDIWFEHGHAHDLQPVIEQPWRITQHKDLSDQVRFSHIHC